MTSCKPLFEAHELLGPVVTKKKRESGDPEQVGSTQWIDAAGKSKEDLVAEAKENSSDLIDPSAHI